ncbi:unnamed protein product [Vitrella brassicaformis CCMP3155]|uniref:Uncharacterized protein n=1 Tax=Vitrella brassicaformis (strain CCMP3155) TaxID=1169540 RepID=A0A0G4F7F6_VITBC|nr:unnamed protein product [Vitrella brassicaformis CCMP3155]|eukprot:CEM08649.1 unnamed protein product [Vitrella brassicaformis CCMP3155]
MSQLAALGQGAHGPVLLKSDTDRFLRQLNEEGKAHDKVQALVKESKKAIEDLQLLKQRGAQTNEFISQRIQSSEARLGQILESASAVAQQISESKGLFAVLSQQRETLAVLMESVTKRAIEREGCLDHLRRKHNKLQDTLTRQLATNMQLHEHKMMTLEDLRAHHLESCGVQADTRMTREKKAEVDKGTAAVDEATRQLQQQIDQLKQEDERITEMTAKARTSLAQMADKHKRLKDGIEKVRVQKEKKLKEREESKAAMLESIRVVRESIEAKQQQLKDMDAKTKKTSEQTQKIEGQVLDAKSRILILKNQIDQERKNCQTAKEAHDAARAHLKQLEADKTDHLKQLDEAKAKVASEQERANETFPQLLAEEDKKGEELTKTLESQQRKTDAARAKADAARQRLQEATKQLDELNQKETDAGGDIIGQVEAKKKRLEQLLSSYEEGQTHMQKLNQDLDGVRKCLVERETKLKEAKAAYHKQRSESEAVARHLSSLKAKAAQQEAAKRDLLRRYEEREAAVRELEDGEKRVEERHKESKAQIDEQIMMGLEDLRSALMPDNVAVRAEALAKRTKQQRERDMSERRARDKRELEEMEQEFQQRLEQLHLSARNELEEAIRKLHHKKEQLQKQKRELEGNAFNTQPAAADLSPDDSPALPAPIGRPGSQGAPAASVAGSVRSAPSSRGGRTLLDPQSVQQGAGSGVALQPVRGVLRLGKSQLNQDNASNASLIQKQQQGAGVRGASVRDEAQKGDDADEESPAAMSVISQRLKRHRSHGNRKPPAPTPAANPPNPNAKQPNISPQSIASSAPSRGNAKLKALLQARKEPTPVAKPPAKPATKPAEPRQKPKALGFNIGRKASSVPIKPPTKQQQQQQPKAAPAKHHQSSTAADEDDWFGER